MDPIAFSLALSLGALAIDSILELAFVTNMVSWLHSRAGGSFLIHKSDNDSSVVQFFPLHGKPRHLLVDQGHASNGAAGTALVLVTLGGALALSLRHYASRRHGGGRTPRPVLVGYYLWLVLTLLSVLLTLSALIFTFVVTHQTSGRSIDLRVAEALDPAGQASLTTGFPGFVAYPFDDWTPETWFDAVLGLPLVESEDVREIRSQLRLMIGWRWNLVPMFILGVGVCVLAMVDAGRWRASASAREGKDFEREKFSE